MTAPCRVCGTNLDPSAPPGVTILASAASAEVRPPWRRWMWPRDWNVNDGTPPQQGVEGDSTGITLWSAATPAGGVTVGTYRAGVMAMRMASTQDVGGTGFRHHNPAVGLATPSFIALGDSRPLPRKWRWQITGAFDDGAGGLPLDPASRGMGFFWGVVQSAQTPISNTDCVGIYRELDGSMNVGLWRRGTSEPNTGAPSESVALVWPLAQNDLVLIECELEERDNLAALFRLVVRGTTVFERALDGANMPRVQQPTQVDKGRYSFSMGVADGPADALNRTILGRYQFEGLEVL